MQLYMQNVNKWFKCDLISWYIKNKPLDVTG